MAQMQTTRQCKILDLREHDGRFYFRFGSGDDGSTELAEVFAKKLEAFKRAFHYRACTERSQSKRVWDSERKEWSVPATGESDDKRSRGFQLKPGSAMRERERLSEAKLAAIFPNAAQCFAILRAQLSLF